MFDYTAIDFETANSYRGSPCAVGLVRVRNGVVVDERRWLIRPPEAVNYFDGFNTMLHGISEETVSHAPSWAEILPRIVDYLGDDVVVAHNAGFDTGVVRYACAVDQIEWPGLRFLCTMVLSRRALSLPSYRLPYVLESLGGSIDDHHDPLADARAVVDVVRGLARKQNAVDLDELAGSVGVRIGTMAGGIYKGSVAISGGTGSRLVRPELDPNADPDGYLYGRVIVFTGTLMSMTRQVAWQECARVGARTDEDVTKKTNVLVVGDINPAVLRPGSNVTGKARKAFELQDKGQDIEVMTEDDFLRCLVGKPLDEIALAGENESNRQTPTPVPTRLRSVSLEERPKPKPPKPLHRKPVPTDQICSAKGCADTAAFKTRTKPTWCEQHIAVIQRACGLDPMEPFTHPDSWQLTRCRTCTVEAHYRFNYTVDKRSYGELTCRACYWRKWAADARAVQGHWAELEPVPYTDAKALAEDNGFDYLGPLTAPSFADDPHHTRCRRCGKLSAERLGDIGFGCTCTRSTSR
ncbi:exonuclease domain-containing protein [Nocardia sp. NBC_01499]|uniref:exonuclease domain-containing protein n=1 Tax=Nocardia sp. NBC_01499 TaxID=2903597 RepID=UPI003867BF6A